MKTDNNPTNTFTVPAVSIATARTGASSKANALGRNSSARALIKSEQIDVYEMVCALDVCVGNAADNAR